MTDSKRSEEEVHVLDSQIIRIAEGRFIGSGSRIGRNVNSYRRPFFKIVKIREVNKYSPIDFMPFMG